MRYEFWDWPPERRRPFRYPPPLPSRPLRSPFGMWWGRFVFRVGFLVWKVAIVGALFGLVTGGLWLLLALGRAVIG
jgi:hypothetical protein